MICLILAGELNLLKKQNDKKVADFNLIIDELNDLESLIEKNKWIKTLRLEFLDLRNQIKHRSVKKKINNFLKALKISSKDKVSGYFPVNGEVNILPYIQFLGKNKYLTCMSLIKKSNYHLLFKSWKSGEKIFKDKFNIFTPLEGKFIRPNIMIVPLLAFDKKKK